ncbi:unnamed protein product, partial [Polarella glacialis]
EGVAHTCQGKSFGTDCWAFCKRGFIGATVKLECTLSGASDGSVALLPVGGSPSCTPGRRMSDMSGDNVSDENASNESVPDSDSSSLSCDASEAASGLQGVGVKHNCLGISSGTYCLAECQDGFEIAGNGSASVFSCDGSSFSGSPPQCVALPCTYSPPDGLGVQHNCSGVGTFSTCEATCGNGYGYASGSAAETFTCTATGEFQGTAPACEPSPCATLGQDSSDGYSHDCSGNVNGDSCIVACADGFSAPNGTASAAVLECGASGYTGSIPTCEPNPCSSDSLPTGLDLEVNCTGLTTGESCMVSCAQGYSGAVANFTCTSQGDFSGQRPICTPQTCDDLVQGLLEGVTHDCSGVRFGSKCGTSCAAGHSLAATSSLTELHCLWDAAVGQVTLQGASPVCEPDPCVDNFPSGESFQHDCVGVATTGVCTVQCAPGYEGSSPQNLSCAASGVLEGDTPNCTARTCAARHLPGMQQGICQDLSFGDSCLTTCEDGYDASSGVQQWTCDLLPGGGGSVELQGSDPDCQPLPCLDNSPVSAQFQDNCAGVTTGSSCDVFCTSDYVGSPSNLTCGADRAFYGSLPVCQPTTTTTTTATITTATITTATTTTSRSSAIDLEEDSDNLNRTASNRTRTPTTGDLQHYSLHDDQHIKCHIKCYHCFHSTSRSSAIDLEKDSDNLNRTASNRTRTPTPTEDSDNLNRTASNRTRTPTTTETSSTTAYTMTNTSTVASNATTATTTTSRSSAIDLEEDSDNLNRTASNRTRTPTTTETSSTTTYTMTNTSTVTSNATTATTTTSRSSAIDLEEDSDNLNRTASNRTRTPNTTETSSTTTYTMTNTSTVTSNATTATTTTSRSSAIDLEEDSDNLNRTASNRTRTPTTTETSSTTTYTMTNTSTVTPNVTTATTTTSRSSAIDREEDSDNLNRTASNRTRPPTTTETFSTTTYTMPNTSTVTPNVTTATTTTSRSSAIAREEDSDNLNRTASNRTRTPTTTRPSALQPTRCHTSQHHCYHYDAARRSPTNLNRTASNRTRANHHETSTLQPTMTCHIKTTATTTTSRSSAIDLEEDSDNLNRTASNRTRTPTTTETSSTTTYAMTNTSTVTSSATTATTTTSRSSAIDLEEDSDNLNWTASNRTRTPTTTETSSTTTYTMTNTSNVTSSATTATTTTSRSSAIDIEEDSDNLNRTASNRTRTPTTTETFSTTTYTMTNTSTTTTRPPALQVCTEGVPSGTGVNSSDCGAIVSGEECVVFCRAGFEGASEIFHCGLDGILAWMLPTAMFNGKLALCTRARPAPVQRQDSRPMAGFEVAQGFFTCQEDGQFTGSAPTCTRLHCAQEGLPRGLGLNVSDCLGLKTEEDCTVTCRPGFEADSSEVKCTTPGKFVGQAPTCSAQKCAVPGEFSSASLVHTCGSGIVNGQTCSSRCALGYEGSMPKELRCYAPAALTGASVCVGSLCDKKYPYGAGVSDINCFALTTGATCRPGCTRGFSATSTEDCTCGTDGALAGCDTFSCARSSCGDISVSVAGFRAASVAHTCQNKVFGQPCTGSCSPGFDLAGGVPTSLRCDMAADTASAAGFVSAAAGTLAEAPACVGRPCTANRPQMRGVRHNCDGKTTGQNCSLSSAPGFALAGPVTVTCSANGAFASSAVPAVSAAVCSEPFFGEGVAHTCQGKSFSTECWAFCKRGFIGATVKLECVLSGTSDGSVALLPVGDSPSCTPGRRMSYMSDEKVSDENASNESVPDSDSSIGCDASEAASGLQGVGVKHNCLGISPGNLCLAECQDGFEINGSASVFSCDGSSFSGSPPQCVALPCTYSPPDGLGVLHNCSGVGTLSTCEATCGNGYGYASGAAAETFTCTATGEFQGTAPACEPSPCATLGQDSSDSYSHDCSGNVNGDSCIVACADGFSAPNGTASAAVLECGASGYTGSIPTCEPNPCSSDSLPTGLDLEVNCTGLTTGESCIVSCAQGYSGAAANFTCTSQGDFSGQRPICTPQTCDDLVQGLLEGVTHDCSGVRFGSKCGTSCAAGHSLAATSSLTELHCLWDAAVGQVTLQGASPVCEPDPCLDNFPSGESFQHDCVGVATTGVCTVQCAPGYEGSSPQNLSCAASGVLEGDTPNCTVRTCASRHLPGMQQGICQDLSFGDSCFTTCEDGYDASSGVQQWTCNLFPGGGGSVELQGSDPDCQPLPCLDNSPVSAQFQHNCEGVTTGSSCDVVCTSDYVGSSSNLTCVTTTTLTNFTVVDSDFPVPEVEDANVSNMSNATLNQEEEFVLNLTDTIEVSGLLSLNVTDAEAFMNDPEALAALKDGLAAAIKVNPAYLTVTVSLTPFTVGKANSRRLASESSALYISYTVPWFCLR